MEIINKESKYNYQNDIRQAIEILRSGGVILYPTDTFWGVGCDATNANAVNRILDIKQHADNEEMVVLIDSPAKLQAYVEDIPDMAWELIDVAEKPLTIIFSQTKNLADNLVGEVKSIGIRVTSEPFSKELCERFRKPIVFMSANKFGEQTPSCFSSITDEIKDLVDYIVLYRQNDSSKPKTPSIIKLNKGNVIKIVRP